MPSAPLNDFPSAPLDDNPTAPPEEKPCTSTSTQENSVQRINDTECVVCLDSQVSSMFSLSKNYITNYIESKIIFENFIFSV